MFRMIEILMALMLGIIGTSWTYEARTNPQPTAVIDDAFNEHVAAFEEHLGRQITSVSIQFAPNLTSQKTDEGTIHMIASCNAFVVPRQIWVSRELWGRLSPGDREHLIMHELGHCLFGLNHVEETIIDDDGSDVGVDVKGELHRCPVSVMNPRLDAVSPCFEKYKEYYWIDLMGRAPQ